MKFLEIGKMENADYLRKMYELDDNIQIDSLVNIAKMFETDKIKMVECNCRSFDNDGCSIYMTYNNIDDLFKLKSAPSPYISAELEYCNKDTFEYCFTIVTDVNSNILTYIVNKKKQKNSQQHQKNSRR